MSCTLRLYQWSLSHWDSQLLNPSPFSICRRLLKILWQKNLRRNCLNLIMSNFYVFWHNVFIYLFLITSLPFNPFPHTTILQQTTLNTFCQKIENLYNWMDDLWLKVETLCQKEKLLVLSNFSFCHYVFKKPSAAEASESVYMR